MSKQWNYFLSAVMFYTQLPCPGYTDYHRDHLKHATRYFPLVGAIVAALMIATHALSSFLFLSSSLSLLLALLVSVLVTGAFHEDGLIDFVDGMGGGWSKESKLSIMKDSRVGSFGSLAVFFLMLFKFEALKLIPAPKLYWVLLFSHVHSRYLAILLRARLPYIEQQNSKVSSTTNQSIGREAVLAGIVPVLLLLVPLDWQSLVGALLVSFLLYWWLAHYLQKKIGGYTGDCLGAAQQLAELVIFLAFVVER